jgi:PhoPQ-activated pathogenicity-related protein
MEWIDAMPRLRKFLVFVALLAGMPARADLLEYVRKPDTAFSWRLAHTQRSAHGTSYRLDLVSQTWQGAPWIHALEVHVPPRAEGRTALLFVSGGAGDDLALARQIGAPVVVLHDVPNQPLLDGKYEDDLIAETFLRYLATGDPDWPLLLPMTKSTVRAMDAVQAFAGERLALRLDRFVVTGASKRGWTSWLAAAVDERVAALAPRVIDMLNLPAQMPHQLASWGEYSEMLAPYTAPGLPGVIATPAGQRLLGMIDPYRYRDRLRMPKLIVLGTNDRYWTLDALNLYWDGLPGEKHVLYIPNAGHGLPDQPRWRNSLACFFRHVAQARPLPTLAWRYARNGKSLDAQIEAQPEPAKGRIWMAQSATRDFRAARWDAAPMQLNGGVLRASVPLSDAGFIAAFGEVEYRDQDRPCRFTTQVTIEAPMF